jgi:hypothetical protein
MSDEARGGSFQMELTNEDWHFTDKWGDGIIKG